MQFDFTWDAAKAARNQIKHGVTFDEASTAFLDPLARTVHHARYSKVRIFSTRPATRRERHEYEEDTR